MQRALGQQIGTYELTGIGKRLYSTYLCKYTHGIGCVYSSKYIRTRVPRYLPTLHTYTHNSGVKVKKKIKKIKKIKKLKKTMLSPTIEAFY